MLTFNINDQTNTINEKIKSYFLNAIKIISKNENIKNKLFFEVTFTDDKQIKKINKKYRNINKVTDVISFAFYDSNSSIKTRLIGEIFIDIIQIKRQALINNCSFEHELVLIFIHGVLHLLQYDHIDKKSKKIMFNKQNKILKAVKL